MNAEPGKTNASFQHLNFQFQNFEFNFHFIFSFHRFPFSITLVVVRSYCQAPEDHFAGQSYPSSQRIKFSIHSLVDGDQATAARQNTNFQCHI